MFVYAVIAVLVTIVYQDFRYREMVVHSAPAFHQRVDLSVETAQLGTFLLQPLIYQLCAQFPGGLHPDSIQFKKLVQRTL